ncbi:hypothetical protein F5879DRAFT_918423 [Lentinula edodes]|nr:hypothetical protein F5879DRAFT_918423 [Lentinula edodes]
MCNTSKDARLDDTEHLNTGLQSHYTSLHRGLESLLEDIGNFAAQTIDNILRLRNTAGTSQLTVVEKITTALSDQGTKEDIQTGSTPQKCSWRYVDECNLTEDRKIVLRAWRSRGMSSVNSETILAEHLPLPAEGPNRHLPTNKKSPL